MRSTLTTWSMDADRRELTFRDGELPLYTWHGVGDAPWGIVAQSPTEVLWETAPARGAPELLLRLHLTQLAPDEFRLKVMAPAATPLVEPIEVVGPLTWASPEAQVIFPFYGEGLCLRAAPPEWHDFVLDINHLDLPLAMLSDGQAGCLWLHDMPPDDGEFHIQAHPGADGAARLGITPRLLPQLGTFGYDRALRLLFTRRGGYTKLLKRYRLYLAERGYLVPLRVKADRMRELERLRGAVNLWGTDAAFCTRLHQAGLSHAIVSHGRQQDPAWSRELHRAGYLVSQYQCYHYTRANEPPGSFFRGHPEATTLAADGQPKPAFVHPGGLTEYQRCSSTFAAHAKRMLPRALREQAITAIYADLTGAAPLAECHSPAHGQTRKDDRLARGAFFETCADFGLVVGTEHGRWWTARHVAYQEGLLSLPLLCPWEVGYLQRPAPDADLGRYLRYGLAPAARLPLYELVFHDCVSNYWSWGDSTDWLHATHPELTDRKDAFNVLTGTAPLVWVGARSGFGLPERGWERFLDSVAVTWPVNSRVFGEELLSHTWLTPDRAVQCTVFANGVEVTVNFGATPYEVSTPLGPRQLLRHGFVAHGDHLLHYRLQGASAAHGA